MRTSKKQPTPPELQLKFCPPVNSINLDSSSASYRFLKEIWDNDLLNIQEQFYAVYLNKAHDVICWRCLNTGTNSHCIVDVRLAFMIGVKCLASAIIVAHNHPSGMLFPSLADNHLTSKFKNACELLEIEFVDHMILTQHSYFSYKEDEERKLFTEQKQSNQKLFNELTR